MIPNIFGAVPQIPPGFMHTMYQIIKTGAALDMENGGQMSAAGEDRKSFQGVILPVGNKDLVRADGGTMLNCTEKIYTNGHILEVGAKVYDPPSGNSYTITQELGHNSLHPMKRYLIERKGKAGTP